MGIFSKSIALFLLLENFLGNCPICHCNQPIERGLIAIANRTVSQNFSSSRSNAVEMFLKQLFRSAVT